MTLIRYWWKVYIQISLSPSVRHLQGSIYIFSQVSTITFNVRYVCGTVSVKDTFCFRAHMLLDCLAVGIVSDAYFI